MDLENKYSDIEQLDIIELEEIIKESPWFSYARHLLLLKLKEMGDEVFLSQLKHSAIFLSSRGALYNRVNERREPSDIFGKYKVEQIQIPVAEEDKVANNTIGEGGKKRVIVAGADFFSKDELSEIPNEVNMEIKLKEGRFYRDNKDLEGREANIVGPDGKVNYDDLAFFTETLGHIYATQGYYEQAKEVFSKLILLYPQKSAYFATLIGELEKNKDL